MTDQTKTRRLRIGLKTTSDAAALSGLLRRIPHGEYTFLKAGIVEADWGALLGDPGGTQLLIARSAGEPVGVLALVPGAGWSDHVAELRLVVDPAERGQGVGRALAEAGVRLAVERRLLKITVEVLVEQTNVVDLFRELGFVAEGLLTDQVRDDAGQPHDLLVLGHPVVETARAARDHRSSRVIWTPTTCRLKERT
ncbi:GNAT family N-acetyltransferase [Nocardioides marmoriginsengisoli]|uniref:GNAT family N-acetyltransferase n=1 Tax=Nocardioides marmoriginsengisoli TaxID=661483 RepID=A0A3N0CHE4_9ACTN|nr:GNAT family N-acetyltransferase [Nocardioides marmoriginsengisoli]RNL62848.1 GNAT family N-acetyltransferase [Nocardioides marmoriginsengisoli]